MMIQKIMKKKYKSIKINEKIYIHIYLKEVLNVILILQVIAAGERKKCIGAAILANPAI